MTGILAWQDKTGKEGVAILLTVMHMAQPQSMGVTY
jgi:hypothetical protein